MRNGRMGVKPKCFRCGEEASELSTVSIKWNTYKGSGSCFAALCNSCVDAIEADVKAIAGDITKDVNNK